MSIVRVITDSAAEFPEKVVEDLDITVLPMNLHLGQDVFRDGVDITNSEFFERLRRTSALPTASPPSLELFEDTYKLLSETTDQIISIHHSSKLSQTVNVARRASESFIGRCWVNVVDSLSISWGLGVLVEAAARAALEGASLEEIVRLVRGMIPHIYIAFFVETLDYLERAGRLSKSQAILGTMLNIKPILIMEEGEIIPLEKVKTRSKALDKLFEFVAEFSHIERGAILQSHPNSEEAYILIERLRGIFEGLSFPILTYGPVLATHIGPEAMGVVIYEGVA